MATRDENLKKINEELEKMSDDELEQVAGGTNGEYKALRKLLPMVHYIKNLSFFDQAVEHKKKRYMTTDEVEGWLKTNLNIDAEIDDGFFLNPFDSAGDPNKYSRNGQMLTHGQVMDEIKRFLG